MSHSNSSLNCFAFCMAKYEHQYVLHTPPCKPPSPHLRFGVMAHDVLHKAGLLRDENADGVVDKEQYYPIIPSEMLYNDLKNEFGINNWTVYFTHVIKETVKIEKYLVESFEGRNDIQVEREVKLQLTVDQLKQLGYNKITQPLVGIIDLLIYTKDSAVIMDYKFSGNRKSQEDFDMNSQLQLYALMVHVLYDIPLHNIRIGYIDIPKQMFGIPTVLSNGKLSRATSQNVSQEMYEKAVIAVHGDDEYYNCKPGGYYYDAWCNYALNKPAYMSMQYLDLDTFTGVTEDLMNAASVIDTFTANKYPFLRKYDAHTCKACEFVDSCKPWTKVNKYD